MTVYFHVVSSTFHHNIYALRLRYHPWISPHKTSIFGLTPLISGSRVLVVLLFKTTRAHTPDPQAQEPLSHNGRRCGRHDPVHHTQAVKNRQNVGEEDAPGPSFCALDRCTSTSPGGRRGGRGRGGRRSGGMCYATGECRSCSPATEYQYGHDATRLATFCPLARGARGCASGVRQN